MKTNLQYLNKNVYQEFSKIDNFLNKKSRPYIYTYKYKNRLYAIPLRSNVSNRSKDLILEVETESGKRSYLDFFNAFEVLNNQIMYDSGIEVDYDMLDLDEKMNNYVKMRNKHLKNNIQDKVENIQRNMYLKTYLQAQGLPTNKQKFICRNKNHNDTKASMQYNPKNNTVHCFSCGVTYNLISLVRQDYNVGYRKALKIIDKMIKEDFKDINIELDKVDEVKEKKIDPKYFNDVVNYYSKLINQTDYLTNRGISKEVQELFKIGFNPKTNQLILPVYNHGGYFFMRNIDAGNQAKYIYQSDMKVPPFIVMNQASKYCFLTEGYIDALSLVECNENVISFNGANNFINVKDVLDIYNYYHYILAFDNDDAGNRCCDEVIEYFKANDIEYSILALDSGKDVNDELVSNKDHLLNKIDKVKHHGGAFFNGKENVMADKIEFKIIDENNFLIQKNVKWIPRDNIQLLSDQTFNTNDITLGILKNQKSLSELFNSLPKNLEVLPTHHFDGVFYTLRNLDIEVSKEDALRNGQTIGTFDFNKNGIYERDNYVVNDYIDDFLLVENQLIVENRLNSIYLESFINDWNEYKKATNIYYGYPEDEGLIVFDVKKSLLDLANEKENKEEQQMEVQANGSVTPQVEEIKKEEVIMKKEIAEKLVVNLSQTIEVIKANDQLTTNQAMDMIDNVRDELRKDIKPRGKIHQIEGKVQEINPYVSEKGNTFYNIKVGRPVTQTNPEGKGYQAVSIMKKPGEAAPDFKEGDYVKLEGNMKRQEYNEKPYYTLVNVKTLDVKEQEPTAAKAVEKETDADLSR